MFSLHDKEISDFRVLEGIVSNIREEEGQNTCRLIRNLLGHTSDGRININTIYRD